ncbi:VacB/RNase II family 3'-5' exoribonuclease [Candidatus Fermentibacteria bacterium]|nr:VacB/RNase II family 3'-5' exoribonuclease [Candidatus Fermentibacteria bacterium]
MRDPHHADGASGRGSSGGERVRGGEPAREPGVRTIHLRGSMGTGRPADRKTGQEQRGGSPSRSYPSAVCGRRRMLWNRPVGQYLRPGRINRFRMSDSGDTDRDRTVDRVMELLQHESRKWHKIDQIRRSIPGDNPRLAEALEQLCREGSLWLSPSKGYALADRVGVLKGRVRVRRGGSAVLYSGEQTVEIEEHLLNGALDGDLVLAKKIRGKLRNRPRAKVVEVLKRAREGVSGVAIKKRGRWKLRPLEPSLPPELRLDIRGEKEPEKGSLVYASLDYDGECAVLQESIGDPRSPRALTTAVAEDNGLPSRFDDRIRKAAYDAALRSPSLEDRLDLRDEFVITIDPSDARDFDDAVSLVRTEEGYRLGVHIADVAYFVDRKGPIDLEARRRGTSVYLPDRVIPMLPFDLSADACSLRPGEDKPCRSVILAYDRDGNRQDFTLERSVIRSNRRLTYEEALAIMEGESSGDPELDSLLERCADLAGALRALRREEGMLDLGGDEFRAILDDKGNPVDFEKQTGDAAHSMIEHFMIEANRAVADHCGWMSLPVLYRTHGSPEPESLQLLRGKLSDLGVPLPSSKGIHPAQIQEVIDRTGEEPIAPLVRLAVLKSMKRAVYHPRNSGHYGLGLSSYLHFTSPIRRYPDLQVHQVLDAIDRGEALDSQQDLGTLASHCNRTEDRAEKAERDALEVLGIWYLERHGGRVYEGVIEGVADFGAFVSLLEVPAEGLLPSRKMDRGFTPGRGKVLDVTVLSANPLSRELALAQY